MDIPQGNSRGEHIVKSEIDIIRDIAGKFERLETPYMLTGSIAMNYYATPRMTRDIDVVVLIGKEDIQGLMSVFGTDYYISKAALKEAIQSESLFNLIHIESVIKVDCIVRKSTEYRKIEFERRQKIALEDFSTYIVSKEDLILSKLVWANNSHSEMQLRDVANLLMSGYDIGYIEFWADKLGVGNLLEEVLNV